MESSNLAIVGLTIFFLQTMKGFMLHQLNHCAEHIVKRNESKASSFLPRITYHAISGIEPLKRLQIGLFKKKNPIKGMKSHHG